MVSMLPAALTDRLGEELRDAPTGLSPKAEGREVASGPFLALSLAWAPCLLGACGQRLRPELVSQSLLHAA